MRFGVIISAALLLTLSGCFLQRQVPRKSSITFERTACYGTCPIYVMTIDGTGLVKYEGKRFTEKLGHFEKQLDRETCVELFKMMRALDWDAMDNEYPAYVSDLPSTIFSFKHGKTNKTVLVTGDHPEVLDALENRLHALAVSEGWENLNIK